MNITINLGEKESSITTLEQLGSNEYVPFDVQITNSHITNLNVLTKKKIIKNNSLYINSQTLYDIMQTEDGEGEHNYHGLTADDIYMALTSIKDPKYIFITKFGRFAIVSIELSHFKYPLMLVLETDAALVSNKKASICKIVTIYPKDHIDAYIERLDNRLLLYEK